MKTIEIKASKRDVFGKKESRKLAKSEMVPCVICGAGGETVHFAISAKELGTIIYTPNSYIIDIDIDGKKENGVIREVQYHPVREQILHVEFYRALPGKEVSIDIPVKITGVSAGVKMGGKLAISKRKLHVRGLIENLPDELPVDITELGLGKSIFVGDLKYDNLTILTPATTAVCAVKMTRGARAASNVTAADESEE